MRAGCHTLIRISALFCICSRFVTLLVLFSWFWARNANSTHQWFPNWGAGPPGGAQKLCRGAVEDQGKS